jgi:xanthine dehydrogenase accessory factor
MTSWLSRAASLLREGTPAMMVTVCSVEGSAPREPGAKMIVTKSDQWGTIGGGNLEFSAIKRAREILANATYKPIFEDYPLGPAFGQCCGGRVRICYEQLAGHDLGWLESTIGLVESGASVALQRNLSEADHAARPARALREHVGNGRPALIFLDASDAPTLTSMPPLEECAAIREVVADERARVFVFGAGHVGTAITKILEVMPVNATLVDRRTEQLPGSAGANVELVCADDEVAIARAAPAGSCFLILTHSHDIDYELTLEILTRGDSHYCGLIGSETKRARFERRLRRAGLDDAQLRRLTCPIGANGLKSKAPASIALSAVHEMLLAHQAHAMEGATWG